MLLFINSFLIANFLPVLAAVRDISFDLVVPFADHCVIVRMIWIGHERHLITSLQSHHLIKLPIKELLLLLGTIRIRSLLRYYFVRCLVQYHVLRFEFLLIFNDDGRRMVLHHFVLRFSERRQLRVLVLGGLDIRFFSVRAPAHIFHLCLSLFTLPHVVGSGSFQDVYVLFLGDELEFAGLVERVWLLKIILLLWYCSRSLRLFELPDGGRQLAGDSVSQELPPVAHLVEFTPIFAGWGE